MNDNAFLTDLNKLLQPLEEQLRSVGCSDENHSNIFVLGLPRSGTTLLGQVLFDCLDLGCINNLSAKFWKTPLVGAYLSMLSLNDEQSGNFQSFYGRPTSVYSPHEFSWFWHEYLDAPIGAGHYVSIQDSQQSSLVDTLNQIANMFSKGFVYKPLELLFPVFKKEQQFLKKSLYVYIERDELDVAASILTARRLFCSSEDEWWSSMPSLDCYEQIHGLPWNIQIAGQVLFLKRQYQSALADVHPSKVIHTTYRELCEQPVGLLERISQQASVLGGNIEVLSHPEPFSCQQHPFDSESDKAMILAGFKFVKEELINE